MNINNNINTDKSSLKPVFPSVKSPTGEQPLAQTAHKKFVDTPTHFETDYISMKWIPEKHRIDVIWKQFVSEDKVREVLLKEVAMIRHTKVKCLFLDAQKFKGTNPNIPRWANEVWSQMVHDAGLKHFATVVSDKDIFAVFSLKYGMGEKLMSLVNCAVFKTIEEGEVWLRQYTHPENPVYSDEELKQMRKEYEKPILDETESKTVENKIEKSENEVLATEIEKQESTENECMQTELSEFVIQNELKDFDLKNEQLEDNSEPTFEVEEEVETKEKSQIQLFANFEDLENHIQEIGTKKNNSDNSENQSKSL